MSPQAQRIAIANAWLASAKPELGWATADGYMCIDSSSDMLDPLRDLNAMHEAEEVLTPRQREVFASVLCDLTPYTDGTTSGDVRVPRDEDYIGYIELPAASTFVLIHATAAQRAEAFLRTLNLWNDAV